MSDRDRHSGLANCGVTRGDRRGVDPALSASVTRYLIVDAGTGEVLLSHLTHDTALSFADTWRNGGRHVEVVPE